MRNFVSKLEQPKVYLVIKSLFELAWLITFIGVEVFFFKLNDFFTKIQPTLDQMLRYTGNSSVTLHVSIASHILVIITIVFLVVRLIIDFSNWLNSLRKAIPRA